MTLTRESLELFAEMLDQASLPVGHPDFVTMAARFTAAKQDVAKALAAAPAPGPNRAARRAKAVT